ncbi:hypothetical protein BN1708_000730 [Verticillium longisporum]|uniref:DUF726 domain protein n=2 Tax=Verticillium longisporum TaxID=100787 RepID=A0A0G4LZF3_VERLO|nr:hypothetical protein BN1708_000730 [Verticillium longisporum]
MAGPAESDSPTSPKPTSENQPSPTRQEKVGEAASKPSHAAPPVAEPVELDDFGLPVRKYIAPTIMPDEASNDASLTKPNEPETPPNGKASVVSAKPPAAPPSSTEASDDDDEFKDANSRAATPQPRVAVKEVTFEKEAAAPTPHATKPAVADVHATADDTSPSSTAPEAEASALPVEKEAEKVGTKLASTGAKPQLVETTGTKTTSGAQDAAGHTPETTAAEAKAGPVAQSSAPAASNSAPPTAASTQHARNVSSSSAAKGHERNTSAAGPGIAGFSHHQATTKEEDKEDEKEEDLGWQEMPSYAPYDIYDDDNKLVAKEHTEEDEAKEAYGYGGLGGAGRGYTRVIMDDDAESATSMDDNTKYLFKEVNGTSLTEEQDEQRDAVSQMQATKDLLTEGQRVAYVGLVRIEIFQLVRAAETIEQTRNSKKWVTLGAEATKMWGQKMMIRVYAHMDISAAEQVMVEQLADHGVIPSDLTPVLMANARVKNPMAGKKGSTVSTPADPNRSSMSLSAPKDALKSPTSPRSPAPPASAISPEDEEVAEPPPPYEAHPDGEMPDVKIPSDLPSSENLEIDLRWTVLCDLFLILIADSSYDARSRVLLERVGKSLQIDWLEIRKFEKRVTDALEMQQQAEKENWNEEDHLEVRRKDALKKRYVMMGLATVGGGLVIGLSAGILAPMIGVGLAAGLTTIGIGGTAPFLGGVGGAAIITTAAASSGGIVGVRAANRRTGAVKTFEYRPLHNNKRVNLIVTVSGWMTGKVDDVRLPFSTVDPIMGDLYSVLWEPEMLRSTGDTINILATEALTSGVQQVLANTLLTALMSALQLPVILTKLAYLIDNPWAVSLDRAWSAGLILADSLIDRNLGTRPITLVGYSIGARVIFSCLQELARRGAYGLVQNVYMFGSPVIVKKDEYIRAKSVVPGRFVNGYNRNDWILGYLFRLTHGGIRRVAGLAAVEDCPWCENMDVTDLVKGHMEYRKMMPRLLRECGWLVESDEFTEIEDPDPDNHGQRQRELINEIEEARKELEKEGQQAKKSRFSIFGRKKKMEKANWEIYEESNKAGGSASKTEVEGKDGQEGSNHGVLFDVDAIRAELAMEEMQVKELQSTLPPMKLDLSASPNPRDSLRGTRSADASSLSLRPSYDTRRVSEDPSPLGSSRGRIASPYYTDPDPYREDEVSMTFDTSFDDPPPRPPPPPKDDPPPTRPEYKSAQTVPNMTLNDPWADPDDEDFGKEKEMTMTFA